MLMTNQTIVSFALSKELKALLKQWARTEDRTVSATLRQILEREAIRRATETPPSQDPSRPFNR